MSKTIRRRAIQWYLTRRRGVLSPLEIRDFRLLMTANALWWATRFMEFILVGWLVLELTDSPFQVAAMGFYRSIPFLVVGFLSGLVIDRLGRRKTMLMAQTVNVLVTGIIALLLWTEWLALWHLGLGLFTMGMAWSIDWPARRSFVPDLVGKEHTVDALLLENFAQNIARIVGPFAGGVFIDLFGTKGAYAVTALLSLVTLALLSQLSDRPVSRQTQAAQKPSPFNDIIEGLRYVRRTPPILGTLLITVVMNFAVFPYITLLPVFARDVLGQGATGLGSLGAAAGSGAFLGLLIINQLRKRVSNGWIFALGSTFQALTVVAFSLSTDYTLSWILLFLSGIGQASFGIMQSSIILLSASDEMRSRAMGTLVLAIGAGPLGQLQIGSLAEAIGAPLAVRLLTSTAAALNLVVLATLPGLRHAADPTAPPPAKTGEARVSR